MGIQRNIDESTDAPEPREQHRLVDTNLNDGDISEQAEEVSLRPTTFADYIGQERLKTNLKLAIDAVKKRNDGTTLDHVLLYGLALARRPWLMSSHTKWVLIFVSLLARRLNARVT